MWEKFSFWNKTEFEERRNSEEEKIVRKRWRNKSKKEKK
jgi:hypothetical protein